jgi:hypothetical protein
VNPTPEARAAREIRKDRRARIWVGLGILIGLSSLIGNVVLGVTLLVVQSDDHHETTTQQSNTAGQVAAVRALETEVNHVILGLPAADKELGQFAAYTIAVNEAICADIVKVAATTGIALAPCPAVPTFAPLK